MPSSAETMTAVVIEHAGGPEVLRLMSVEKPFCGPSEVLVRVRASALNRADILQRKGKYPAPPGSPTDIPGMEFAGEVEATGSAVQLWRIGDRVMGLVGGGAYAEYVAVHERTVMRIPAQIDFKQAAAIPEAFMTAHDALWVQAAVRPSERVLIHAVGSGVGLAAIQLARALNAIPFGTARTPDKLERAKQYSLAAGFLVSSAPTPDDAKTWSTDGAFDAVLDLVGGAYTNASLHALAHRGRIMLIGTMGGAKIELDSSIALGKRAQLIGTVLRARPLEEKITATRRFAAEVIPLFANGTLQPVIDSSFDLRDVRAAHERMESNQSFGKIVLCIGN
jgi:putative PIG3 family NAD(P)H quinone oxidoreductase